MILHLSVSVFYEYGPRPGEVMEIILNVKIKEKLWKKEHGPWYGVHMDDGYPMLSYISAMN